MIERAPLFLDQATQCVSAKIRKYANLKILTPPPHEPVVFCVCRAHGALLGFPFMCIRNMVGYQSMMGQEYCQSISAEDIMASQGGSHCRETVAPGSQAKWPLEDRGQSRLRCSRRHKVPCRATQRDPGTDGPSPLLVVPRFGDHPPQVVVGMWASPCAP